MKKALFPVIALVLSAVGASVANAAPTPGRKLPGPSAVQAARLKKYPPPNYLSHYLPDDRYKIAGNVWKYVSTDLDTYYHVPSSPNMLRQPANRVIGFANARDAEEAGYVADPTDGTATRAVSSTVPNTDGKFFSDQEAAYLKQMRQLLIIADSNDRAMGRSLTEIARQPDAQTTDSIILSSAGRVAKDYVTTSRRLLVQLNRLKPPARLRRFHTLLKDSFTRDINAGLSMYNAFTTLDMSSMQRISSNAALSKISFQKAMDELVRLQR
jgi:hypothetical protein